MKKSKQKFHMQTQKTKFCSFKILLATLNSSKPHLLLDQKFKNNK